MELKTRAPSWGKAAVLGMLVLTAAVIRGWAGDEAQAGSPATAVVYFYPKDYQPEQQYIDQVDPNVAHVQQWYGAQVGKTFAADPVVAVQGDHNGDWYKCNRQSCDGGSVWYNVLVELRGKGYSICRDQMLIVFLASSIPFQGGGGCGGTYTADVGGVAMLTDTLFDPALGKPSDPEGCPLGSWCYDPDASRGVIAHELGHAFSLPHPKGCGTSTEPSYCAETVMWGWWSYPDTGLLDLREAPEKGTLAGSPFFWVSVADGGSGGAGTPDAGGGPDTTAPTVKILNPSDGETVRGRWLRVAAEGSDDVRVAGMELYIDSQLVFATTGASLDHKWDMRGASKGGSVSITVKAFDEAGNASAAQVNVSK